MEEKKKATLFKGIMIAIALVVVTVIIVVGTIIYQVGQVTNHIKSEISPAYDSWEYSTENLEYGTNVVKDSESSAEAIEKCYELLEKHYPDKSFQSGDVYYGDEKEGYVVYMECLDDGTVFTILPKYETTVFYYQNMYWSNEIMKRLDIKLDELYEQDYKIKINALTQIYDSELLYYDEQIFYKNDIGMFSVDVPKLVIETDTKEDLIKFYSEMGFKTYDELIVYLASYDGEVKVRTNFSCTYAVEYGAYGKNNKDKIENILSEFVLQLPNEIYLDENNMPVSSRKSVINVYYLKDGEDIDFYWPSAYRKGNSLYDGMREKIDEHIKFTTSNDGNIGDINEKRVSPLIKILPETSKPF